ncbi:hypothetical protein [Sporomusa malonica]|uniref:Phage terminase, small subunit, putative, P27 family n=1 Tax=Sporomusa malonica TaxID=112901 RepID=A0A1W2ARV8_9FIRM|nr:hypothetical protein [Sporomusa malonica]SMC63446.1 hypothetical protein SAMN04488500_10674 [Sporomusa malonica]
MSKAAQYQTELDKWQKLFAETTPATQEAVSGLIEKVAYVHSLCWEIEQSINSAGAIKKHPQRPELQKINPQVKEYARLSESYAGIINKLNALRVKNTIEEDDELDEYE